MLNHQDHSNRIRDSLQLILQDDRFRSSPQMSAFLTYIVEQTLSGQSSRIKAYTIAVDALGKPDTFDPQSNPSVRVLAKRLRDNLKQYHAERARETDVRIFIKPGSYVPHFETGSQAPGTYPEKNIRHFEHTFATVMRLVTVVSDWIQTWHRQATAVSVMLMAILVWTLTGHSPRPPVSANSPSTHETELFSIDIASMEQINPTSGRPPFPRLTLINDDSVIMDSDFIGDALQKAMQSYEHFITGRRESTQITRLEHWPEDYELHYSRRNEITLNLSVIHVQTGKILQKDRLDMSVTNGEHGELAVKQMIRIQGFGRNLLKNNGVILQDYRERGKLTPVMRCAFLFDDYYSDKTRTNRQAAQACAAELHAGGKLNNIPLML